MQIPKISPQKNIAGYLMISTFEEILDIDMFMKLAPASVATALASIVFPVPGGPNSKIPLHGWWNTNQKKKSASYWLSVPALLA